MSAILFVVWHSISRISKTSLSANHLVYLELILIFLINPIKYRPDWGSRSLPPPKRSILHALDQFRFKGVAEYLEELMTFLNTPQLNLLFIIFFNQIDFDCPRLAPFINRTITLGTLNEAYLEFKIQ